VPAAVFARREADQKHVQGVADGVRKSWPWQDDLCGMLGRHRRIRCVRCSGKTAKYVGMIPHDLRRTGVRNLIRAEVPRSVAMKISGHQTELVFERYNITSQEDLREAARSLTRYLETKNSQSTTKVAVAPASSENQHAVSLLN
jgi:hypothetical protein